MSAFITVLHLDGRPAEQQTLNPAVQMLRRIGPDGHGIHLAGNVGFGHVRLKIFDQSGSGLAFVKKHGVVLAGDVFLARRDELIRALAGRNTAVPADASDLQLLHAAWRTWGEGLLRHVSGEFSFALWDERKRCLFAARDQLGVRPLYYHQGSDSFYCSNALNSFRHLSGAAFEPNRTAMADYLLFGFCHDFSATGFAGVQQLPPGHSLSVTNDKVSVGRYWDMPVAEPMIGIADEELVERFSSELERAVTDRLGPGPVNIPFSGGMDSGAVAAMAQQYYSQHKLKGCINLAHGMSGPKNEDPNVSVLRAYASSIGARFGLHRLDDINVYAKVHRGSWTSPDACWYYDSVVARSHLQDLAKFSPLALTGQGGDVLFLQNYQYIRSLRKSGPWGLYLRELLAYYRMHGTRPPLGLGLRRNLEQRFTPTAAGRLPVWINPGVASEMNLLERFTEAATKFAEAADGRGHPRAEFIHTIRSPIWQYVLGGHHAHATGLPLEFRHPLFDLGLVNFMASVTAPRWHHGKALARRALRQQLPEELLARPKQIAPLSTTKADVLAAGNERDGFAVLGDNCVAELIDTTVFSGLMRRAEQVSEAEMMSFSRVLIANDWCNSLESIQNIENQGYAQ